MSCIFVRKFSCDKDDGPKVDLTSTLSATNDSTDPKGGGNREKIDALEIKTLVYPGGKELRRSDVLSRSQLQRGTLRGLITIR